MRGRRVWMIVLAVLVAGASLEVGQRRRLRVNPSAPSATADSCSPSPCISSVSGTISQGTTVTINGAGFGSHANYGGSASFINRAWNDFESSLTSGNWAPDGYDPGNVNLSTSAPRGGASRQFYRKTHTTGHQQGAVATIHRGSTGIFYFAGWYRESASSPELGHAACTKYLRHYMADSTKFPEYNWYFGPGPFPNGWGNATGLGAIFGHNGRYNGSAARDVFHPQNVWRFMEVIEFFGTATSSATSIYGSNDYMEHRLNNTRLMRRGSGLAANATAAEGSDANENQRWVASAGAGTADGHDTSLGSHLCDSEAADAFMDWDDVYLDYTIARVMLGNASTFASSTAFELQPLLSWSSTAIQIQFNRGAFATGTTRYLFVIDANNNVTAGYAVTIT